MDFKNIMIDDKEIIEKYTKQNNYFLCDHCFTDIFMWRYNYSTKYCIKDDFLFLKVKSHEDKQEMYLAPLGSGDLKKAVLSIMEYARKKGNSFIMLSIPEQIKERIEKDMPDTFIFEENRDNADYIYLAEDLINLKGKKFHSKRNFINRFKEVYDGRWRFGNITKETHNKFFKYKINGNSETQKRVLNNFFTQ